MTVPHPRARQSLVVAGRALATFAACTVASGVVVAPLVAQHATESVRFDDYLGAVPVRVSLTHNGVSTLDTGVLGRLYWDRTGAYGFGALLRVTGPPEAGGPTLAAYVDPAFSKTSTAFVDDPPTVAASYARSCSNGWSPPSCVSSSPPPSRAASS